MRTLSIAALILALCAPVALAQPGARTQADAGPVLTTRSHRLWSLRIDLSASAQSVEQTGFGGLRGRRGARDANSVAATIFVPVLARSASHETLLDRGTWGVRTSGSVSTQRLANPAGQPDLVELEHTLSPGDATRNRAIDFEARIPVRTAETVYDDARAARIDWPTQWPEWVRPALRPSAHIPSDHPFVTRLLNDWTGANPRAMPPALLAKHLAKRIIDSVQPNGLGVVHWDSLDSNTFEVSGPCDPSFNGFPGSPSNANPHRPTLRSRSAVASLRGFDVYEVATIRDDDGCFVPRVRQPIEAGRANPAIIANLYVSLLRAAGVPARVVIGTEIASADLAAMPDSNLVRRDAAEIVFDSVLIDGRFTDGVRVATRSTLVRFWAEFFLYDERSGRGEWIPVDLHRQRAESSRAPDIDRPWRYFGNHDELDEIVPISSVYAPVEAATVSSIPALWGWSTDPTRPPHSMRTIMRFEATGQPRRANDGLDPAPNR